MLRMTPCRDRSSKRRRCPPWLPPRRRKLTEIDHGTAVTDERDRLRLRTGQSRADRHGDALPYSAAERVDAEMRSGEVHITVAERAVRQRDVAHERMAALRDLRPQRVRDEAVGAERRRELLLGLRTRRRYIAEEFWRRRRASPASARSSSSADRASALMKRSTA